MAIRNMLLISLVSFISVSMVQATKNNGSNFSDDDEELVGYLDRVEPICRKLTGSNETYEKLLVKSIFVPFCITSKLDVRSLDSDLENLNETTRAKFFPKYCPQLRNSLSCLEPATAEFRKCLNPKEVEVLDIIINMLPEGLNVACKDNGQIFFVDNTDFSGCSNQFVNYAKKCAGKISNVTEAIDLANYGTKQCNELAQVRECFEQQLVECKAPRLMDIFDLFYRPIVDATPCRNNIECKALNELPRNENNTA